MTQQQFGETALCDPYASRGTHSEIVPREDPVLWGGASGPLTWQELRAYERDGFHFFPQLVEPAEATALRREAEQLARHADRHTPGVITEPGSPAVRTIFRIHHRSEMFRRLCKSTLAEVARQLLGSEVYVHQSRINFKPAFDGKEFFWHSDFETWHMEDGLPRMRAVSISLSLTESHEFNGPLMVVPGSHHYYVRCMGETPENHYQSSLKKQEIGVPSREALAELTAQRGIVAPKGNPGSALLFECNTMHGSVGNLSPHPRTNLFVVFNSVENQPDAPFGGMPPRPEFLAEREVVPASAL